MKKNVLLIFFLKFMFIVTFSFTLENGVRTHATKQQFESIVLTKPIKKQVNNQMLEQQIACSVPIKDKTKQQTLTPDIISSYVTKLNTNPNNTLASNRILNVKLAAAAIDDLVLNPGEEFSFKNTAGKANGYLESRSFKNGKLTTSKGGGMCQVSSTLFNAALIANMNITERRSHSALVKYIPPGLDAAYSKNSPDFKFVNSLKNPIRISAKVSENNLTINILGTKLPEEDYRVNITTKEISKNKKFLQMQAEINVTLNNQIIKKTTYNSRYKLHN